MIFWPNSGSVVSGYYCLAARRHRTSLRPFYEEFLCSLLSGFTSAAPVIFPHQKTWMLVFRTTPVIGLLQGPGHRTGFGGLSAVQWLKKLDVLAYWLQIKYILLYFWPFSKSSGHFLIPDFTWTSSSFFLGSHWKHDSWVIHPWTFIFVRVT